MDCYFNKLFIGPGKVYNYFGAIIFTLTHRKDIFTFTKKKLTLVIGVVPIPPLDPLEASRGVAARFKLIRF